MFLKMFLKDVAEELFVMWKRATEGLCIMVVGGGKYLV